MFSKSTNTNKKILQTYILQNNKNETIIFLQNNLNFVQSTTLSQLTKEFYTHHSYICKKFNKKT